MRAKKNIPGAWAGLAARRTPVTASAMADKGKHIHGHTWTEIRDGPDGSYAYCQVQGCPAKKCGDYLNCGEVLVEHEDVVNSPYRNTLGMLTAKQQGSSSPAQPQPTGGGYLGGPQPSNATAGARARARAHAREVEEYLEDLQQQRVKILAGRKSLFPWKS